jgi:hypothetical protein
MRTIANSQLRCANNQLAVEQAGEGKGARRGELILAALGERERGAEAIR